MKCKKRKTRLKNSAKSGKRNRKSGKRNKKSGKRNKKSGKRNKKKRKKSRKRNRKSGKRIPGRWLRTPYTVVNDRIRCRIRPYTCHLRSVYDRILPYYM
jgi:hypothetical protein